MQMRPCVVMRVETHQSLLTVLVAKMQLEEIDCILYEAVRDEITRRRWGHAGFLEFL